MPTDNNLPKVYRSSYRRYYIKKMFLKTSQNFTGKHLCRSLFFNKFAGPTTLLKMRLRYKCFPVNFENVFRTISLQNTFEQLFLGILETPNKYDKQFTFVFPKEYFLLLINVEKEKRFLDRNYLVRNL